MLEFVGSLEMTGSASDFSTMSAFRFLDGDRYLPGVTDAGLWFDRCMARDAG
jgi:hypothetical protein